MFCPLDRESKTCRGHPATRPPECTAAPPVVVAMRTGHWDCVASDCLSAALCLECTRPAADSGGIHVCPFRRQLAQSGRAPRELTRLPCETWYRVFFFVFFSAPPFSTITGGETIPPCSPSSEARIVAGNLGGHFSWSHACYLFIYLFIYFPFFLFFLKLQPVGLRT